MKKLITFYQGPLPYKPTEMGLEFAKIYSARVQVPGPVRGSEIYRQLREGTTESFLGEEGFARRDTQDLLPVAYQKALDEIMIAADKEKDVTKIVVLANPLRKKKITIRDLTIYPASKHEVPEADHYKYQGVVEVMMQVIGYRRMRRA